MKHYTLKVTTIRHFKEDEYKQYKKWIETYIRGVDFKELEEMGMFVERTAKPDEDVKSIYELSITDMRDDLCGCGGTKLPESDFCKDCI